MYDPKGKDSEREVEAKAKISLLAILTVLQLWKRRKSLVKKKDDEKNEERRKKSNWNGITFAGRKT